MKSNNCPHCKADLDGGLIPEGLNEPYEYEGEISYPYGKNARWERQIGIEYPEKYDGVWEWQCPDCKGTWPSEANIMREGYEQI